MSRLGHTLCTGLKQQDMTLPPSAQSKCCTALAHHCSPLQTEAWEEVNMILKHLTRYIYIYFFKCKGVLNLLF